MSLMVQESHLDLCDFSYLSCYQEETELGILRAEIPGFKDAGNAAINKTDTDSCP